MHTEIKLEDRVNRTCRVTAALRALELMKNPQDPIVRDELAAHLAGEEAIARLDALWDRSLESSDLDPKKPQHSYFAGRARLLDDRITAALQQLCNQTSKTTQSDVEQQHQQQLQVVSLGCGLDSRPWRMDFPAGAAVAWFDLDQQPVIDLKATLLVEAGAEVPQQQQQQGSVGGMANSDADVSFDKGSSSGPAGDLRYPLKCSSYTMLAVDLASRAWVNTLHQAGFVLGPPTVWVAEGLLYYLSPHDVMQLMINIAKHPDIPMVIAASHIPLCNLEASKNASAESPLKSLFVSCVDDLNQDQLKEAYDYINVSKDLAVLLKEEHGAQVVYPYSLDYSGGRKLDSVEVLVELARGLQGLSSAT